MTAAPVARRRVEESKIGYDALVPRFLRPRWGSPSRAGAASRPDARLAARLGLASGAVALVAVPFTLLWVLVRTRSGSLEDVDGAITREVTAFVRERPVLEQALEAVATLTSPWGLRAVSLVVAGVLVARGYRRLALWLVTTIVVGGVLGLLLKLLVQRARPVLDDPLAVAGGYSFPSGHALNSMLFAAAMLVLVSTFATRPWRIVAWVAAVVLVVGTGFDRVGLGVHFASDVLGGWAVGLATVLATVAGFDAWRRREDWGVRRGEPELLTPPDDTPGASHPLRDALEGGRR